MTRVSEKFWPSRPEMALPAFDLPGGTEAADAGAFEELYRRHAGAAFRAAFGVVHNADDARDAVSEAFARVMRARPEARSFQSYLVRAARNAAVDIVRRRERGAASVADLP